MGFFNNNDSLERAGGKSFFQWIIENRASIETHLIGSGIAFLNGHGEDLKTPISSLLLDNRWHYLDKPTKKQSYRGSMEVSADGVPFLHLTYYTFRHGNFSAKFDSKQALKEIFIARREGRVLEPKAHNLLAKQKPASSPTSPSHNWIADDWVTWQNMAISGQSHYLNRKGFGKKEPTLMQTINLCVEGRGSRLHNVFFSLMCKNGLHRKRYVPKIEYTSNDITIPGIRFGKNHIAIAIVNTEGAFQGLQRIANDGSKLFTKGLHKKGHFAVIGQEGIPKKLERIHIAEGVATAISIHQATGEVVFVALDAFNLFPVGRALKKHFPKTPIVLWADNDWQKAENTNRYGEVLGNTGRIQANAAAFKLSNALVCTPDFSEFDPILAKDATDFNDLHRLGGLEALSDTKPQKPELNLALWHSLKQYNKYAHGVLSPQQFTVGSKEIYSERYLPEDVFHQQGIHLVRSAIGTGKTEIVEKLVKKYPEKSVIFTTHLISLVESAATRLGLVSYNECDRFDLQMENRLAICLNSLGKLTAEGSLRPYDIVIIDEIEQVLARLTTHIEQKPLVFAVLKHLMMNAKTLICLDAHLSKTTAELIQRFCPFTPVTIHFNTFEPGKNRNIAFHESEESIQMAAMQALEESKNVYLTFNSKKEAYKTFLSFQMAFPEKRGLFISGDNTGDKANIDFFSDVNAVSRCYEYIVCTPSVSTGVSIDNNHFDFVGGIFKSQVNTANDCMQALGRIRNHPILHVFCEKRMGNKPLNPDVISSKWLATHAHDMNLMNIDNKGARVLLNEEYERLVLLVTQARNRSFNNFYEQFALLALSDGMNLTYFENTLNQDIRQQLRDFKSACIEQDLNLIVEEDLPLTAMQLVELAKKSKKTLKDTQKYKKQQLIDFYNLPAHDTESIKVLGFLDHNGHFKKKILALELALGDAEHAKKRFLEQTKDSPQFAADLNHFATQQELYKELLKTLYVTGDFDNISMEDYRYSKDDILTSGFISWVEKRRDTLQGIITIPPLNQLQKDPIRFLSMLLARLGLKQKRVGRAEEGIYHLDANRLSLLNSLITRRKPQATGLNTPLDTSSVKVKEPAPIAFFVECFQKIKRFFTLEECGTLAFT